jgi:hypothetical protein
MIYNIIHNFENASEVDTTSQRRHHRQLGTLWLDKRACQRTFTIVCSFIQSKCAKLSVMASLGRCINLACVLEIVYYVIDHGVWRNNFLCIYITDTCCVPATVSLFQADIHLGEAKPSWFSNLDTCVPLSTEMGHLWNIQIQKNTDSGFEILSLAREPGDPGHLVNDSDHNNRSHTYHIQQITYNR